MYAPAAPSSQATRPFLVQRIHAATAMREKADISSSARAEIQSTAIGCALGVIANASVARPAASGLPSPEGQADDTRVQHDVERTKS